jgi:voltage-gated potassium channel
MARIQMARSRTSGLVKEKINLERASLLTHIEDAFEIPMLILSFVWLALIIVEFTRGLSPILEIINVSIWVLFLGEFLLKIVLAPRKWTFIKHNIITLLALVLPALRVFRITRAARILRLGPTVRGLRLARVLSSLNRGMSALRRSFARRGFGYVICLTLLVCFAGAAGIFAFEKDNGSLQSYWTALWWTAMVLTTMGSDFFPKSPEGRLLCLLLAIYGFAVFGYVTATVATFFVGREAASKGSEIASQSSIEELKREIQELRRALGR